MEPFNRSNTSSLKVMKKPRKYPEKEPKIQAH